MNKKIFLFVATIFFLFASLANANSLPSNVWRLDGVPDTLPVNFRLMTDDWRVEIYHNPPTKKYLDELHVSASGQPTFSQLKNLFDELKKHAPNDKKIYLVDLRQETHGFADEYPVSWYVLKNRANVDKNFSEIEIDERQRLANLRGQRTTFLPLGKYDTEHFQAVTFAPTVTLTEKQAAESVGFRYARFYALDMTFPAPEVVEDFINFSAQIDSDSWLHFHCQAGQGRTTNFIVMFDILKHPDLPLEDIVQRQFLLGGAHISDNAEYKKNIQLFYKYVHELNDGTTSKTWGAWLKQVCY